MFYNEIDITEILLLHLLLLLLLLFNEVATASEREISEVGESGNSSGRE